MKPRLKKAGGWWYCATLLTTDCAIGFGREPCDAYRDWRRQMRFFDWSLA